MHQATHLTLFPTAICRPTLGDCHAHAPHRSTYRSLLHHQEYQRRQANKHRITRPSTALCKDLNKKRKGSKAACFCSCREARQKCTTVHASSQRAALAIEARYIRHRSALHPSIHARASEAPTPSLSSLTLLRKFGKQIMHFFPQRKTGRCFAATPCHSLGTSLCLRRKIVFRISVAKIQQPFAFCKF